MYAIVGGYLTSRCLYLLLPLLCLGIRRVDLLSLGEHALGRDRYRLLFHHLWLNKRSDGLRDIRWFWSQLLSVPSNRVPFSPRWFTPHEVPSFLSLFNAMQHVS